MVTRVQRTQKKERGGRKRGGNEQAHLALELLPGFVPLASSVGDRL